MKINFLKAKQIYQQFTSNIFYPKSISTPTIFFSKIDTNFSFYKIKISKN